MDETPNHTPGGLPPLDDDEPVGGDRWRRGRRVLIAGVAVLLLLGGGATALALNGGDDGGGASDGVASVDGSDARNGNARGNGTNRGGASQGEMEDAALAFARCMREHGVDMPDPQVKGGEVAIDVGGGEPGFSPEKMDAAHEACQPIMDKVAPPMELSPEQQAEMRDQQVALAQCMRKRGYDFPDPQVDANGRVTMRSGPGEGGPPPGGDEEFEKDMEECGAEAGLGRDGPRFGSGGSGTDSSEAHA